MTAEPRFDPVALARVLNEHRVRYVVVGGFAVASYGVVRATADLDVVVDRSSENAGCLGGALTALEARDPTDPSVAFTAEVLVRPVKRRLETIHGALHLLSEVEGVPVYADLAPGVEREVEGVRVPVATLDAVREMKRRADRDKDRIDLAELDALDG